MNLRRPLTGVLPAPSVASGGIGERLRVRDWSGTSLGPPAAWPPGLHTAVGIMLSSPEPMLLGWGSELALLYNDAAGRLLFSRDTDLLAQPFLSVLPELWSQVDQAVGRCVAPGEPKAEPPCRVRITRPAPFRPTACQFTCARISPLEGAQGGVLCTLREEKAPWIDGSQDEPFLQFMQHLPGLAWIKDEAGRYLYANEAALAAFGRSEEELLGLEDRELFDERTAARFRAADEAALSGAAGIQVVERLTHPDGSEHVSLVSKFPIRGSLPGPVLIGGIAIDITERKRAEEALLEANRRKDEFLATLGHELRNPLAPIRNGLHILRLAGELPGRTGDVVAMMERQVGQMVRLIEDLLDVSRISQGRVELRLAPLDVARTLLQAVENSRPLIEELRHRLSIDLPREPLGIQGDADRLAQVFSNLLNNAAKYTPPGGDILLTLSREGHDAVVRVRDTGVGIPPAMLERVFDLFEQVDSSFDHSRGGLGIGLNLARSLVRMHQGRIEARSDGLGAGSEFVVRLPLTNAWPVAQTDPEPRTEPGVAAPRRRILVADDNELAGSTLGALLRLMGNEVRTARDGFEAVEIATTFQPDVILLDIGMPRLNGYEACRSIRSQPWARDAILVALTGWGQDEARLRSHEAGFTHHLVKPVSPDALESLLGPLRG
jgi:PAS domain S-box-containing protein